jgi:uncharacterized integral membrane protein
MRDTANFIINAHKSGSIESTTRLQTSFIILVGVSLLSAIIIVYLVDPNRFSVEPWGLASIPAGLIVTALTGKVVGAKIERSPVIHNDLPEYNNQTNQVDHEAAG